VLRRALNRLVVSPCFFPDAVRRAHFRWRSSRSSGCAGLA
jgi:hypothetical protein